MVSWQSRCEQICLQGLADVGCDVETPLLLPDHPDVGGSVLRSVGTSRFWNFQLHFCQKEVYSRGSDTGLVFPT